ncbi:MAG: Crp/Fnr family transcriptional regulator [Bacteroidales bacterium]|nr:Crp/Fnr family transcriptional regulator [Bacteroidales bacterium]
MGPRKDECTDCKLKFVCFDSLNTDELALINENKVQIRFKKGEIVSKQGTFVTHVMYIKSGYAKIYKETDIDNSLILDVIPSGRLIGLSSLFNKDNISRFSVAALDETTVCSIERSAIEKLIHQNSLFSENIITLLNKSFLQFFDKMASLTQKQMNGRVADALLYLSEDIFDSNQFKMILSRKDLANFTGMSMMSVVRTLKEFKLAEVIENKNGFMNIKDKAALKEISEKG